MTWEEYYSIKAKVTAQAAALEVFLDENEDVLNAQKTSNYRKLLNTLYEAQKALDIIGEKHRNIMLAYSMKLDSEKRLESIISSTLDLH